MSDDLIKRSDAIKALCDITNNSDMQEDWHRGISVSISALYRVPSADRPSAVDLSSVYSTAYKSGYEKGKADGAMIYGNEHNCIMTIFGECSYAETGCGDCAVVEKVRKALSADRPQGEWEEKTKFHNADDDPIIEEWQSTKCSVCGKYHTTPYLYYFNDYNFCPNCGAKMKGADDEFKAKD